jgi:hypothetical protein
LQRRARSAGKVELDREALVAQRVRDARFGDDIGQLLRPKERHGPDRDPACFQDCEPARRHHRPVEASQKHAVAGDEAQVFAQDSRDTVGLRKESGIRPFGAVLRDDRPSRPPASIQRAVEQFERGVQSRRIMKLRQVEDQVRPLFARRKTVARERVDVRGCRHDELLALRTSRPTISRCTSDAPS